MQTFTSVPKNKYLRWSNENDSPGLALFNESIDEIVQKIEFRLKSSKFLIQIRNNVDAIDRQCILSGRIEKKKIPIRRMLLSNNYGLKIFRFVSK